MNGAMKADEAQSVLDPLIRGLGEKFAQIRFESQFCISMFVEAHREISDRSVLARQEDPDNRKGFRFGLMWVAASATDVRRRPPTDIAIGGKQALDEQLIEALIENLDGQHLWLLVQGFEAIETYYKSFYYYSGSFIDD